MQNLEQIILDIVNNHSGGIKFTTLIADLVSKHKEHEIDIDCVHFPDQVEQAIRNSSKMKILDYMWTDMNRAKMFVYTP